MTPRTQADLTRLFARAFDAAVGTVVGNAFERNHLVRSLARKLEMHFDAIGWPSTEEEALTYVREAIDRYC